MADGIFSAPSTLRPASLLRGPSARTDPALGTGQALDEATLDWFEPRFGRDFAQVRLHVDAAARDMAQSVHARAFTRGAHIALGPSAPPVHSDEGRHLLAHELTHVVQQADGRSQGVQCEPVDPGKTNYRFDTGRITLDDLKDPEISRLLQSLTRDQLRAYRRIVVDVSMQAHIDQMLAPKPVSKLATRSLDLTQAGMDHLKTLDYWGQRTWEAFDAPNSGVSSRLGASAEESVAVYAALWQVFPLGAATAPATKMVTIPPNAQRKQALLYTFEVQAPQPGGTKPSLQIRFQLERAGSVVAIAEDPPKGYIAPVLSFFSDVGFAESADRYFATHRDERRQVAWWLKHQSGDFEQLLLTHSTPNKGGGAAVETLFMISGTRAGNGDLSSLSIELRPGGKPTEASPGPDDATRDYGDLEIERARSVPDARLGDRLGHVDLDPVPMDERLSVKYVIARYFVNGTRDAEVNAVIPIAGTTRLVFYKIRFRSPPDNEVDVVRIGVKGASAKLDPERMDIARARDYEKYATDAASMKGWLAKRYPGIKPVGTTVEELRTSANQSMSGEAGTAGWYKANYKATVLDGKATLERLRGVHSLNAKQTPDTDKADFSAAELRLVELSLQTLSDSILNLLRYVRLGRKKFHREGDGSIGPYGGQTFWSGTNRTVVIYDSGMAGGASAFRGGPEGVNVPQAMLITHEFGHITESATSAKKAFDKYVAKTGIKPFTDYAQSKPDTDFFAEAFAISQTDPAWLRAHHPDVHAWFETLNRTGRPPAP